MGGSFEWYPWQLRTFLEHSATRPLVSKPVGQEYNLIFNLKLKFRAGEPKPHGVAYFGQNMPDPLKKKQNPEPLVKTKQRAGAAKNIPEPRGKE